MTQKYWKVLTPDRLSFYDMKTKWEIGASMPAIEGGALGEPCGAGYHLGKTPTDAIGHGRFPMSLWEAEPRGELLGQDGTKARFTSAAILREAVKPRWLTKAERFVESIKSVRWLDGHGQPRKSWRLHENRAAAWDAARNAARDAAWAAARDAARNAAWNAARAAAWDAARNAARDAAWDAARDAARNAAWNAARDAAWDAARDAALIAEIIVSDLRVASMHRRHAIQRWEVWERGYGLLCDFEGALYVYRGV